MAIIYLLLEISVSNLDLYWAGLLIWLIINVILTIILLRNRKQKIEVTSNKDNSESEMVSTSQLVSEIETASERSASYTTPKIMTAPKRSQIRCSDCNGTGWVRCECKACQGKGRI